MLSLRRPASLLLLALVLLALAAPARAQDGESDVLMQGYYWAVPTEPISWYDRLHEQADALHAAGFTHLWLPPPWKAQAGVDDEVGFLPHDHFDFGSEAAPTRYGTAEQLLRLTNKLNDLGIAPGLDSVLNHMGGGELEWNPIKGEYTPTRFRYPHGVFEKDYNDFHPSHVHPDNRDHDHKAIWGMDLCQDELKIDLGMREAYDYAVRRFGFHFLRLDAAPFLDEGFLGRLLEHGALKGLMSVGELFWHWTPQEQKDWIDRETGGKSNVFDFQLAFRLAEAAKNPLFDMRGLDAAGFAAHDSAHAVTFVKNHDTDREHGGTGREMLGYAFILTMEGLPTVYYRDYFDYGLKDQIDRLMAIRRTFAGGTTSTLHADADLFIAERSGREGAPGLVTVLNNHGTEWRGAWVTVKPEWAGKDLVDHTGNAGLATRVHVADDGRVELWAPPGGYAVYSIDAPLAPPRNKPLPRGEGEATSTRGNRFFVTPEDRAAADEGLSSDGLPGRVGAPAAPVTAPAPAPVSASTASLTGTPAGLSQEEALALIHGDASRSGGGTPPTSVGVSRVVEERIATTKGGER